jgi:pimeloyl-ACP methyl ester carboxylesterase
MLRQRLAGIVPLTLIVSLAVAVASAAADPPLGFSACPSDSSFSCATLPVPLDRGGQIPGAVALSVERRLAGATPSTDAVVGLAGGPGQAALPLADFMASALAPALKTRDLLVFDQRGTGKSDPLDCVALDGQGHGTLADWFSQCALQIGAQRGLFTTQDSVQDLEALRATSGYDKLVLYGTSYGTKVALEYAARYPQHVEALLLDSVVPTDAPDPFQLPTLAAIRPALSELCSSRACAGITATPLADIAALGARLHAHALSGTVYDGAGHPAHSTLNTVDLLDILQAGDLNPALRALLPAAVRSALRGDPDPLLRLNLLSKGLIPNVPGALGFRRARSAVPHPAATTSSAPDSESNALNAATICEEAPFPWQRTAPVATRRGQALAALRAIAVADFYPFDPTTSYLDSPTPNCLEWPNAAPPPPPAAAALPDVPTLILSGAQDLRTPTSSARAVAASIPGSQLLVVPYTGHSVIGDDLSGCAKAAVAAFFSSGSVQPCKPTSDTFTPTPIAPTKVDHLSTTRALPGKPGRTLTAVLDSVLDLERQMIGATLQANQRLPVGAGLGGLHGGVATITAAGVRLRRFSFITGIQLSGLLPTSNGKLQTATVEVAGAGAAPGTVRISNGKRTSGTLGGKRFDIATSTVKLSSAASAGQWPAGAVDLDQPLAPRIP